MRHAITDVPDDVLITTLSLIAFRDLPILRQVSSLFNSLIFLAMCYKIEHGANDRSNSREIELAGFIAEKACISIKHISMICPLGVCSDLGKAYAITGLIYDRPLWFDPTSPMGNWYTCSMVLLVKYNSNTVIYNGEDNPFSLPKLVIEDYLKRTRCDDTEGKRGGKRQKLLNGHRQILSLSNACAQHGSDPHKY